jgi:hypothetical protein
MPFVLGVLDDITLGPYSIMDAEHLHPHIAGEQESHVSHISHVAHVAHVTHVTHHRVHRDRDVRSRVLTPQYEACLCLA